MPDLQFWRNASGQLTFEMVVPVAHYQALCGALAEAFDLVPCGPPVDGWDLVIQDYRRGEQVVGLEWDNWMGFVIVAKSPASEPLVRDMANWLVSGDAR